VQSAGPSDHQLQAILGSGGQAAYKWWSQGVLSAQSVGVISNLAGRRMGTGFLVRGGDFIPALGDELIVMTNAHVVSDPPVEEALEVDIACIVFEAVDIQREYKFKKVLWQSGLEGCDCTLLRLQEQPAGIKPLEISKTMTIPPIPRPEGAARPLVYVIGYPGGRELTFSFQDNDLLDHEAPPAGTPPKPGVCYFHYRAPTEGGSSGSPVFEAEVWRVIALHHAGGKDRRKLNGKAGTEPANEGIWIQSIVKAAGAANVQV
jgi:V8-like Glu-specific endopeptidase